MQKKDKKNKIEIGTIKLPAQEVLVSKYPYDLKKEYDFVKGIDFDIQSVPEDPRIQTSIDKFILFRPELKKLYEFLQKEVDFYVLNVLRSNNVKLKINSSWVAKQVNGSRTEPHVHVSVVDGCFYINVPDKTTPLGLDTYNCLGVREDFFIEIENGDLVLWDNELSHFVPQNNNKETRYSLAFNTSFEEQFDFSLALYDASKKDKSKDVKYLKNIMGEAPGETTDTIIKYIHNNNLRNAKNQLNKKKDE